MVPRHAVNALVECPSAGGRTPSDPCSLPSTSVASPLPGVGLAGGRGSMGSRGSVGDKGGRGSRGRGNRGSRGSRVGRCVVGAVSAGVMQPVLAVCVFLSGTVTP